MKLNPWDAIHEVIETSVTMGDEIVNRLGSIEVVLDNILVELKKANENSVG